MGKRKVKESPIACNLAAMDATQRERHKVIAQRIRESVQEVKDLHDGYTFRLPPELSMVMAVAEFITLERLCCPFFTFALEVESEGGPLWLRMRGREGVKEFLLAELGLNRV